MKKSKRILVRLAAFVMILMLLAGSLTTVWAKDRQITGFAPFDIREHYLSVDFQNRPQEEELLKYMPSTLEVYFEGSQEAESVNVTWQCITGDYLTTREHYVQFSPVFEEETAENIDILRDAPYIGVFLQDEMTEEEETLNGSSSVSRGVSESPYEQEIYTYLTDELGFSAAAACGIMANIESECSFYPNNLQSNGNKELAMTDAEYTAAVDNGSYAKETFSHDGYGYGLMQWTWWSRKAGLYDYARERGTSIGDCYMQLDFTYQELQSYTFLNNTLKQVANSAQGAYDSAYYWCKIYEQPADTENRSIQRGKLARDCYWPLYGTERIAGSSRYRTAVAAADYLLKLEDRESFDTVVLACGSNFPDALSGVTLAARYEAPILLVNNSNSATGTRETVSYVKSHLTANGRVYLLGAEPVVSAETEKELENQGYEVIRLAGSNRYETNLKIVHELKVSEGSDVYIASGSDFADALSASGYAAADEAPIFLADKALTREALNDIAAIKPAHIYIIGGEKAVSKEVENQLSDYTVSRLEGNNRYETSKAVAEALGNEEVSDALITTGTNFPDGLVAGVLAAKMQVPILLVSDYHTDEAASYLEEHGIEHFYVMGETGAVSDAVVKALRY